MLLYLKIDQIVPFKIIGDEIFNQKNILKQRNDASHSNATKTDQFPKRINQNDVQVLIVTLNSIVRFYDRYCNSNF